MIKIKKCYMFGDNQYFNPELEKTNKIHPTALIGPDVVMGGGNYIGPFCYITGDTTIGNNNHFEAYCSIGAPPEHAEFRDKPGRLIIEDNGWFREFITINAGTVVPTIIGDNVTMLRGSHVGHDSVIRHDSTLSCNVLIGGHSYLFPYVNFGLGAVCHQRSVIGAVAMIGMNSTVTKTSKIWPCRIYTGSPVTMRGENVVGMQRYMIADGLMDKFVQQYKEKCSQD